MLHHLSPERREQIETAHAERLVALFYDQVIESLHVAISAIARNDIQERCNATTAAMELLSGIVECMDPADDDEIGCNIRRIHSFIIARLPRVNLYNDARFVAEAIRLIKPLRDAFTVIEKHADELQQQAALRSAVHGSGKRPHLSLVTPVG